MNKKNLSCLVCLLLLGLVFVSCKQEPDDIKEEPKIVAEQYRGRFESVAFSGNWYVISENQIEWENYIPYPAYNVGADLYIIRYDGDSGQKGGTFTNKDTLIDINNKTYKRVTQ